jgi:hypothetical protein
LNPTLTVDEKPVAEEAGKLSVTDLVRMFEESEEGSLEARGLSERDRDYYDNIQLTAAELAALKKRGQPAVIDNRIKTKIDYLVGLEKSQRVTPRALPRTPMHEEDANSASQVLDYEADRNDYNSKRSAVWKNLLVEGSGGISVAVEQGYDGKPHVVLRRWAWDRMFADPHSSEADYSDAGYWGGVVWMDYADALAMYPDKQEILDSTMNDRASLSETYDDKPKFRLWADKKRKRVRVCQIEIKRDNKWYFAEFTKGGILKAGPSPYVDDKGESDSEMVFQSAYVNRENDRYGLVREMISLQDSINKRKSKSLHLLNTRQIWYEEDAVDDIDAFRSQAHRPDGVLKFNPGALSNNKVRVESNLDLAAAQFQVLQEDKSAIDLKGPNATMMGDKAQGSSAASGRAILASQQGGMIQLGDLMDNLRHLDKRVFKKIWNRIRQFYTAEQWVRITDDERNVKWVGMNVDPQQVQMAMQNNPEMAEKISGVVKSVAELDCDIIIDEVPDGIVPAVEQFQSLVELKQFDTNNEIPFRAIVAASPNLKDKQRFLEAIDKQAEERQANPQPDPEVAKAQAQLQIEAQKAEQAAGLAQQKAETDAQSAQQKAQADASVAQQRAMAEIQLKREIAAADIELEREKAAASIEIERMKATASMANQAKLTANKAEQREPA